MGRGIIVIRKKKQQIKEIASYTMSHCSRGNGNGGHVGGASSGYPPTACCRRLSDDGGAPREFDDGDGESWGVARCLL